MLTKIWHCKDCGADFLAPHYRKHVELHPELDGDWSEVWYETFCPECDSEFVEEVYACEACGSHPKSDGSEYCAECQERMDSVLDSAVLKLQDLFETDDKEEIEDMLDDYIERRLR